MSEKTLNMERMVGHIPQPRPRVTPLNDEKISEDLRRLTLQISNYINRTSLNTTLEGLACEFIIDSNAMTARKNIKPTVRPIDHAILIGIIGYKFRGNVPTWVQEQGENRNADLLCTLVPRIDVVQPISNFPTSSNVYKGNSANKHTGGNRAVRRVTHRITGPDVVSQMADELKHYETTLGSKFTRSS